MTCFFVDLFITSTALTTNTYIYRFTWRMKSAELVGDLKLRRTNIRELPVDTVAQSVERLFDRHDASVRIQTSVIFLIFTDAFFLLCYHSEALQAAIFTGVCMI